MTHPGDVSWFEVLARLGPARSYWLNTVGPNGAPHVAPVWGAVVEPVLYLYTERSTVKARNLANDPRAVVHLESAEDVVIVHATLQDLGHPQQCPSMLAALAGKYTDEQDLQYLPPANPDVVYAVRPQRALLWRLDDYENSQRRWRA